MQTHTLEQKANIYWRYSSAFNGRITEKTSVSQVTKELKELSWWLGPKRVALKTNILSLTNSIILNGSKAKAKTKSSESRSSVTAIQPHDGKYGYDIYR